MRSTSVTRRSRRSSCRRGRPGTTARPREDRSATRLLAIDAGLDAAALRARYPDRRRYAIVRGRIKPTVDTSAGGKRVTGYIEGLDVSWVNVPRQFHPALAVRDASFTPGRTPRYAVTVAFGRRFEPWMLAVSAIDDRKVQ